MKNNKFLGFSLSEALIAIAIISIIAAITVPNVITSYQKQTFLTMLQKNYRELKDNLLILQTENYNKTF